MKSIKRLAYSLVALSLALPAASNAEESGQKLNPWTDCGIGAMVFSDIKPAAAISNVIWDLGTTAVTSAGASENTCSGKREVTAARFINNSYANLEEETIKGDGQHLHAMLDIVGCESAAHQQIIGAVRAEFSNTLKSDAYLESSTQDKAQSYYSIVYDKVAGDYANSCQVI